MSDLGGLPAGTYKIVTLVVREDDKTTVEFAGPFTVLRSYRTSTPARWHVTVLMLKENDHVETKDPGDNDQRHSD